MEEKKMMGETMFQCETFSGDVKDVCAKLKEEAQRCKGMTVSEWLRRRRLEKALAEQFGCSVEEIRKIIKIR